MSDFHQTGVVTTFHRLGRRDLSSLESDLRECSEESPIALVLPCLALEVQDIGLKRVVDALRGARYLRQIVVSVSGAKQRAAFEAVRDAFDGVETLAGGHVTLIWNDGPRLTGLRDQLAESGLSMGAQGKGRGVWLGYGYVLATQVAAVIATHDCDIRDYGRELLARLCYPVAYPTLHYDFAKGYYARVDGRLYGRVTRLFVTPLLRALRGGLGPHPLLDYLDSFRYALAGECSMTTDLARIARIPNNWGLEIAILAEVFRHVPLERVCQVELADNFDHRHQELSEDDSRHGLHRMVIDITVALLQDLVSQGLEFDSDVLNRLMRGYAQSAQDAVSHCRDDSVLNGLEFDYHDETLAVETFSRALQAATKEFPRDPLGASLLPDWALVSARLPKFFEEFREAVEADAQEG